MVRVYGEDREYLRTCPIHDSQEELMATSGYTDYKFAVAAYVDSEKGVNTPEEALQGAMDIIAENISDNADYRTYIRDITMKQGSVVSEAKNDKAESVYENYYHYQEPISKVAGHRILALNRGEGEKIPPLHRKNGAGLL